MGVQLVAPAKAEDTTIIKKENDAGQTTLIKKQEEHPFLAAPGTEKKVIIRKDRDDD